jgi:threonine dehydratase
MTHRLSLDNIEHAAGLIDPVFLNSPQYLAESLGRRFGCRLLVKVETANPIRSFKGRGAECVVESLKDHPHLVCSSTGNFGQGMAYAARKRGVRLTVFVPAGANPLKVERMRGFGAEVRIVDGGDEDEAAAAFASETGARHVHDGHDAPIAEGAATIAGEILRWPEPIDGILVPLGDGSLLAGIARWVKAHRPATRIVGVCAAAAPSMQRSWQARRPVEAPANTIAEGLSISLPHAEAIADFADLVEDVVAVEEQGMIDAMRLAHRELGLVLEPSGAAGLAALAASRDRFHGQLVAVILTGSNLTADQARTWLREEG